MSQPRSIGALLQLLRWPGAVTAAANAFTGFVIAHEPPRTGADFVAVAGVAAGGALVYLGGVALNDLADAQRDVTLHPERPIPSGRVSSRDAALLGSVLVLVGIGMSVAMAGWGAGCLTAWAAVFALAYDFVGKRGRLSGSLLMGLARGANAAAGVTAAFGDVEYLLVGHVPIVTVYPIAVACFTALLTYTSTFEEKALRPWELYALAGALALLPAAPWPAFDATWRAAPAIALVPLAVSLGNGARDAQRVPGPGLGAVIRSAVFGFMLVDAAWLFGRGKHHYGMGMLLAYVLLRLVLARSRS